MKMTEKIYSQEVVMQKYPLKTNGFMAIVIAVALLPLAAIAVTEDQGNSPGSTSEGSSSTRKVPESNKQTIEVDDKYLSRNSSKASDAVENPDNLADDLEPLGSDSNENGTSGSNGLAANSDNNPLANSSNDPIATKPSNTGSATSAYDNITERQNTNEAKPGTAVESPSATPTKKAPWYNLNYLLGGGLLLLILGGALLLFLKISKLQDEIERLRGERQSLKAGLSKSTKDIEQLKMAKSELEFKLSEQAAMHNQSRSNFADDGILSLEDAQVAAPVVEDLSAADRQQLATSITQWFATNRGQTKLADLVPADIQKKLNHWRYSVELWGQGDGVDLVDTVKGTMHASVVSLIKPDNQGFAYCLKKPNSLSSVWVNKAWYAAQLANSTLEVIGEPLEIN